MGTIHITSGTFRGRKIHTPEGSSTRPLLTRVRKSLADVLRPALRGARVLDCYGGSGAIAFELLSNGAAYAAVIELRKKTADIIRHNALTLDTAHTIRVYTGNCLEIIPRLARSETPFDIIIVAPPYGQNLQQKSINAISRQPLLCPGGTVVVQRETAEVQTQPPPALSCLQTRRYGRTVFDFFAAAGREQQSE